MSHLIDADTIITALIYDEEHEETQEVKMSIADFLDSHTVEGCPQNGGWISVKDRLPETNDEVLTTYLYDNEPGKRYVETAGYFDDGEGEGHWHSVWDEFSIGRVRKTTIAWMPMPKPYKPPKED